MKIAKILSFFLIFSVFCCGTENNTQNSEANALAGNLFSSFTGGSELKGLISEQSKEVKEALVATAKENGYEVIFGKDKSTTIKNKEDGIFIVQNSDGTVSFGGNNTAGSFGDKWPKNKFTELIPTPPFKSSAAINEDNTFAAQFNKVPASQIKEYINKVKRAGFNKDVEFNEMNISGNNFITFSAQNNKNINIHIISNNEVTTLTIEM